MVGCGSTEAGDDLLPAPDPDEGIQVAYAIDVAPGAEAWKCNVLDLPSDKWMSVNHVESVQNASMHHMDLIAIAAPDLPPGEYECADVPGSASWNDQRSDCCGGMDPVPNGIEHEYEHEHEHDG